MGNLKQRIERIEKGLSDQPCARTPYRFLMRAGDAEAEADFQRRVRERATQCTCGRPFHVRKATLHLRDESAESVA